jgi:V/A-type H+-transporting ATPase subunit E
MNGIDKITARIEADAVADAARIAQEAQAQAETIRSDGDKKAQERYWQKVQEGVKATEDRASRLAKAADMEARKNILAYKQSVITEAFDRAEKRLLAMSGDEYINFLAGQAARASVTGREEIVLSQKDKKTYGSKVVSKANALLGTMGKSGKLTLAEEEGDFSGGLVLRQGNVSVNCTVAALMEQARETMASVVATELFN